MTLSSALYQPLPPDTIRLLHVAPGVIGDDVVCSISIVALDPHTRYNALSYCWGEENAERQSITLQGRLFHVRQNLFSALQHVRYTDRQRVLWIDAICIYQDRHRTKYCRNFRFEPLFREGVGSAHLASLSSIHTHMSLFGLLRAGSGSSTIRSPFMILSRSLGRLERTCYMDKSTAGFKFRASHWFIASVTLAFLTVIAFDTLFSYISNHPLQSETSRILLQGPSPQEHAFNDILPLSR